MYRILFIHPSLDGHLGGFRALAVVNSAAVTSGRMSPFRPRFLSLRLAVASGVGKGHLAGLRRPVRTAIFKMDNQQLTYCTAQGTLLNVMMWQLGRGGQFGGEWIHVYMYGWVPLLSTGKYHNIVNQPYSNIKYFFFLKKKSLFLPSYVWLQRSGISKNTLCTEMTTWVLAIFTKMSNWKW